MVKHGNTRIFPSQCELYVTENATVPIAIDSGGHFSGQCSKSAIFLWKLPNFTDVSGAVTQQIPGIKLMPHSNYYNVLTLSTNDLQWSLCHVQYRQTLRCIARGICVYAPYLLWTGDVMRCQTELCIRCVAPLALLMAELFKHQWRCQPIRSPYSNTLANRVHATPEK